MLKFVALYFSYIALLFSDNYIISYQASVKNALLINEKLSISKAMTPCRGRTYEKLLLDNDNNSTFQTLINTNLETFHSYIRKLPFSIKSYEVISQNSISSLLLLRLAPTCFTVKFNEGFVTIAPIKREEKF